VLAEACLTTGLKPAGAPEPAAAGAPGDDGREIRASRRGRSSEVFDFEAEALGDFRRAA